MTKLATPEGRAYHPAFRVSKVAICATGPSANRAQVARAFDAGYALWMVNDAYRLEPEHGAATVLYACDRAWWLHHHDAVPHRFLRVTQDRGWREGEAQFLGLTQFKSVEGQGLGERPPVIHSGMSSSFQLLNIAYFCGVRDIVLIGHDLGHLDGRSHFFGDHPGTLQRDSPYRGMIRAYESAVPQLEKAGVVVRNASMRSNLRCFPFLDL